MKLAIVGSSVLTHLQAENARWLVQCVLDFHQPELVISGGAPGVDTIVANAVYASKRFALKEFLPEHHSWDGTERLTGFKHRNMQIAAACDYLVCIRNPDSQTYGSGWTANYAETLGKTVRRIYV